MASAGWEQDFDFYVVRVDEHPMFVFLDLNAIRHAPLASHPNRFHVRLKMKQPDRHGLRSSEEKPALDILEDTLAEALTSELGMIPVGRVMTRGLMDFVFYASDAAVSDRPRLRKRVDVVLGGYTAQLKDEPDAPWAFYRKFLYPDPYSLQFIWNRRLLAQREAAGDDIRAARPVDHAAYFKSAPAAQQAADGLTQAGFKVAPIDDTMAGQWSIRFTRTDALADDRIDDVVKEVLDLIIPLEGAYDGWGAVVMDLTRR
jgi:hypothetical protein